jgi:hypothetical protein
MVGEIIAGPGCAMCWRVNFAFEAFVIDHLLTWRIQPLKVRTTKGTKVHEGRTIAEIRAQHYFSMIFHISKKIMLWPDVSHFSNQILAKAMPDAVFAAVVVDCLHQV